MEAWMQSLPLLVQWGLVAAAMSLIGLLIWTGFKIRDPNDKDDPEW